MRFSENRKVAFVVLVVCVLVSIFGLGAIGLARERGNALKVYDRGSNANASTRQSVSAYLDEAAENARLAASAAQIQFGEDRRIDAVTELAEKLAGESSLQGRSESVKALENRMDDLFTYIASDLQLEEESALWSNPKSKDFMLAYSDFRQAVNKINYDDYPKLAAKYNDLISGIPGGIVASLTGQGPLATFGG